MALKIGDVVTLKSGGIPMTVEAVEENAVHCIWSEGKKQIRDTFHPDMLREGEPQTLEALIMASMKLKDENRGYGPPTYAPALLTRIDRQIRENPQLLVGGAHSMGLSRY